MAETLISPGVLSIENDQSFITQQPITVGAAIIGPTVKGPVEVPTVVTSYSDYQNKLRNKNLWRIYWWRVDRKMRKVEWYFKNQKK